MSSTGILATAKLRAMDIQPGPAEVEGAHLAAKSLLENRAGLDAAHLGARSTVLHSGRPAARDLLQPVFVHPTTTHPRKMAMHSHTIGLKVLF